MMDQICLPPWEDLLLRPLVSPKPLEELPELIKEIQNNVTLYLGAAWLSPFDPSHLLVLSARNTQALDRFFFPLINGIASEPVPCAALAERPVPTAASNPSPTPLNSTPLTSSAKIKDDMPLTLVEEMLSQKSPSATRRRPTTAANRRRTFTSALIKEDKAVRKAKALETFLSHDPERERKNQEALKQELFAAELELLELIDAHGVEFASGEAKLSDVIEKAKEIGKMPSRIEYVGKLPSELTDKVSKLSGTIRSLYRKIERIQFTRDYPARFVQVRFGVGSMRLTRSEVLSRKLLSPIRSKGEDNGFVEIKDIRSSQLSSEDFAAQLALFEKEAVALSEAGLNAKVTQRTGSHNNVLGAKLLIEFKGLQNFFKAKKLQIRFVNGFRNDLRLSVNADTSAEQPGPFEFIVIDEKSPITKDKVEDIFAPVSERRFNSNAEELAWPSELCEVPFRLFKV